MREIRQSGSEGGGTKSIASPYPYLNAAPSALLATAREITSLGELIILLPLGEGLGREFCGSHLTRSLFLNPSPKGRKEPSEICCEVS